VHRLRRGIGVGATHRLETGAGPRGAHRGDVHSRLPPREEAAGALTRVAVMYDLLALLGRDMGLLSDDEVQPIPVPPRVPPRERALDERRKP
jgi:hypothetical protein